MLQRWARSCGYSLHPAIWRALFTESTLAETTVDHNILDLLYSSNPTEYSVASAVAGLHVQYLRVLVTPGYEPNTSLCWIYFGSGGNEFDDEARWTT